MTNDDTKILEILNSSDSDLKIDTLFNIQSESLSEEVLIKIVQLISEDDKGVVNAAANLLSFNGSPQIPYLLVPLVTSETISLRNLAGEILLKIGDGAITAMIQFLPKGNNDDLKFIIDLLGLIANPQANHAILDVFYKNENENVLLACIEAFGNLKCTEALSHLFVIYEQNELFKPTIIEAIGKIGSKEGLDFIIKKYHEEEELTKFSIVESLGLIGNEETFFFLLSELSNTSGALTWPFLGSIYALKEKFNFDIPFDERMKNSILETLFDADIKYKKVAAYLVMIFNDPDIILAALNVFGQDFELDETLKPKFIENSKLILSKVHSTINQMPKNLLPLLNLLRELVEEDHHINEELSPLELRNLTDSISNCFKHPDEEVRQVAIDLIFAIDPKMGLLFIDIILDDDNMWNRLRLLDILEMVQLPEANEALQKLAEDPEEMINERAKEILSTRTASSGN
ncbi:MAG: hypothetical protein KF721_04475 [Ignavibacteriaceae bacterium]|nr:hypothetical protein [Ignavibacteriaceae bacterium]